MRLMSAHADKIEKCPNFAKLEHVGIVYDPDNLLKLVQFLKFDEESSF